MALSNFKKLNASGATDAAELSRVVTQLQANVAEALAPLQTKAILDGVMLQKLPLIVGANTIQHKLGRKVLGYFIISQSAASTFFDDIQTQTSLSSFTLTASVACNANLWVF